MNKEKSTRGFSAVVGLLIVLVLAVIGFAGYFVWQKNKDNTKKSSASTLQNDQKKQDDDGNAKPNDPSEGGKYLVIKEWKVRVALPAALKDKVAYKLGEKMIDTDGGQIQAAKVLLKNDPGTGNECAVLAIGGTDFIDAAAQILQTDKARPFDAERYKGTLKADLLVDGEYKYHLNYIMPDCVGPDATQQVTDLQAALVHLERAD